MNKGNREGGRELLRAVRERKKKLMGCRKDVRCFSLLSGSENNCTSGARSETIREIVL